MNFKWLKSILPKGLYGRAALILILPIVSIQLVVSVVFIQRHFDGVTRQMTRNVAHELQLVLNIINDSASPEAAGQAVLAVTDPLGLRVMRFPAPVSPGKEKYSFDDLTGKSVVNALRSVLPTIKHVDLVSKKQVVVLHITTKLGLYQVEFSRTRISASNPHQLLVLMIVVSILMTFISFIFLRNQVRPIRRLAHAAEAFGKGQWLDYKVSGATEVRQAGWAFLDMRDRIERQIEQRTLMLSGVSHDLRTPLTRLKLGLSLGEQTEDIEALSRDVDDMEQMLEEFLAFARGDSREQTEQIDPLALASQIASDTQRAQGSMAIVLPEAEVQISVRPLALRRALDNLVTNSLRYGTNCRLSVELPPREILFIVEDDGPGIPPDQRAEAVRPFVRLDAARNQDRGTGVGLGLAIASDIATSHGGSLSLGSSEALAGLKVTLRLPR